MARVCVSCKKKPTTGNLVSHSNIHTRTRWIPNLKRMRAVVDGITQKVYFCTRCIRSGKVLRPVKRTYKPSAQPST